MPSSAPPNVRSVAANSTSITIEWDPLPCLQQKSTISRYGIIFRDSADNVLPTHPQDAGTMTHSEIGLKSDSTYSFEVYAIGDGDLQGPSSPPLEINTTKGDYTESSYIAAIHKPPW